MNITIYDKKKGSMTLLIEGTDVSYINALRRYMAFEVPTLAIEEVEFQANNSALYDEIVAHRLGLIPLVTDLKSYSLPPASGELGPQHKVLLTLHAQGPKVVTAGDLICEDSKVKAAYPDMVIVKLLEGQDIQLVATAIVGVGRTHAKWSPGLITHRAVPNVIIKANPANRDEVAKSCPVKVFEVKASKLSLNKKTQLDCTLCGACTDLTSDVDVQAGEGFFLTIESWGQLDPKDIVAAALDAFGTQLRHTSTLLEGT